MSGNEKASAIIRAKGFARQSLNQQNKHHKGWNDADDGRGSGKGSAKGKASKASKAGKGFDRARAGPDRAVADHSGAPRHPEFTTRAPILQALSEASGLVSWCGS